MFGPFRPIHVTDADFEEKVLNSPRPVVVDFWATWSRPCLMVARMMDELAMEYGNKLVVAKVNTDENPEWATRYGVQGTPTMLFVRYGKLVDQVIGAAPKPLILQRVDTLLCS